MVDWCLMMMDREKEISERSVVPSILLGSDP
jgi:hypothetical protein